jgi:putative NIF3 family GTP cyclohydrolase 1 type 2
MKVSNIIAAVERFAAPELQEEYDNVGLITGAPPGSVQVHYVL